MNVLRKNKFFILVILITIGIFLRFYNLNWGAPYYFHPDERNIADLVLRSSLSNPDSLLKGTFAYGNFPIILTLLLKSFFIPFFSVIHLADPFARTIIALRTISSVFSVMTMYLIYLCGKFWSDKIAFLALFLSAFSTGFIQQSHFGTFDGTVTFFAIAIFYFLLKFIKTRQILFYYLSIIMTAAGSAAKINLIILMLFPLAILVIQNYKNRRNYLYTFRHCVGGIILLIFLTFILSPNYITLAFLNSLFYERSLVTGTLPVFYTQSFYGTRPVIFQFIHIFPLLINPLISIILLPAFLYTFYKALKTKSYITMLPGFFFLILFLPQSFLFAKWSRYMTPALPFIYLIISIAIFDLLKFSKKESGTKLSLLICFLLPNAIFGASYFITAFSRPDTRIAANIFAKKNIPEGAKIMSEPYDLGLMPLNAISPHISTFNFYEFDNNSSEFNEQALSASLQNSDYIILPSQRLIRSRLLNKDKFPKGHAFYLGLLSGKSGYQKIYETPCDALCQITYLKNPTLGFEETANVFERPTVFIFKKVSL